MNYQITDGTVSVGGKTVLSHIDFAIRGAEKIALVGRNGAGKTTLLRVIAGELDLDRDDKRNGPGIHSSRAFTVEMLKQQPFLQETKTVEELLDGDASVFPLEYGVGQEQYEREYLTMFTAMGFEKEDVKRPVSSFSGGEQTKIALIRLLLKKPDILLLDEPTNHLDMETVQWLECYLKSYEHAVVMVSHDRFFLDRTAQVVYELENGRLTRYVGGYTAYKEQKQKTYQIQKRAYERQQEEIKRLTELIERFKNKPAKAAFARSRKKMLERMERIEKPEENHVPHFPGGLAPLVPGSKWTVQTEHLKIGYDTPLFELGIRIRRGQKIGILGENGAGKTTLLKTIAGLLPPLEGSMVLGNQVSIGYFDQFSAAIQSEKTVLEHFREHFPSLTDKEVRSTLGAYLFRGTDVMKRVDHLSGGEKARLVLAELLQSRPSFLILDEPTNHMDIPAKETLEAAFRAYTGTILFVSHDRYFLKQVAQSVLTIESHQAFYYPFGYEHYLERKGKNAGEGNLAAQMKAEEQALIAGLKAVPKAERHRLKELPTEELYEDWQLTLSLKELKKAEKQAEEAWEQLEEAYLLQTDCPLTQDLQKRWEMAQKVWLDACLSWYDIWQETEKL